MSVIALNPDQLNVEVVDGRLYTHDLAFDGTVLELIEELDIADRAGLARWLSDPGGPPDAVVHLSQEQPTRVRGDVAAIKTGHYRPSLDRFKLKQLQATLCWHRGAPLDPIKS